MGGPTVRLSAYACNVIVEVTVIDARRDKTILIPDTIAIIVAQDTVSDNGAGNDAVTTFYLKLDSDNEDGCTTVTVTKDEVIGRTPFEKLITIESFGVNKSDKTQSDCSYPGQTRRVERAMRAVYPY